MLWFTVWTVLVAGTLVGAFWLGRDLWRRSAALFAELGRASDVVARLGEGPEAPAEDDEPDPIRAEIFDDRAVLRGRVERLRHDRDERAARRGERHLATIARWRAYSR